jgi:DNA polymerase-3 subunit alpha
MIAALEDAIDYGQRTQKAKADPQMGLFDLDEEESPLNAPLLPETPEYDEKQILAYEKELLGFYLSGHPLAKFEKIIAKFADTDTLSLKTKEDGQILRIGGTIRNIKTIQTKKGDTMAFITLEDMVGSAEVVVFPAVYTAAYPLLQNDQAVFVQGAVQKDDNSASLLADVIIPIQQAEQKWTASIHFHLDLPTLTKEALTNLHQILLQHTGGCEAYLHFIDGRKTETVIALPNSLKLKAGIGLNQKLEKLFGYPVVKTVCLPPSANGLRKNGRNNHSNSHKKRNH